MIQSQPPYPLRNIGDVVSFTGGFSFRASEWKSSGVPVIKIANVRDGKVMLDGCSFVDAASADASSAFIVQSGDLLMTLTGEIGALGFYKENFEARLNQRLSRVSVKNSEELSIEYLHYFLSTPNARRIMWQMSKGAAQANISVKDIATLEIPVPPLDVQKRIVQALDDHLSRLDRALAELENSDSQTFALRRSILNALLSPAVCHSEPDVMGNGEPKDWRATTLGDECEIASGSTPKTNEPKFWDGDIPWLTPADLSKWRGTYIDGGARYITAEGLNSCSARLLPKSTVMMSSRAPIGYTAIAGREMCTNQGFKSMLPSETVNPEWLRYYLEHALPEIKSMASGTTFAEISGKKLGTLALLLPPLEEQLRIVETLDESLSKLDSTQTSITARKTSLLSLRKSLLNKAFKGEIGTT